MTDTHEFVVPRSIPMISPEMPDERPRAGVRDSAGRKNTPKRGDGEVRTCLEVVLYQVVAHDIPPRAHVSRQSSSKWTNEGVNNGGSSAVVL
eukprot:IDg12516t1